MPQLMGYPLSGPLRNTSGTLLLANGLYDEHQLERSEHGQLTIAFS